MAKPRVIVITGYGINCEEETAHAFRISGAEPVIAHINDIIDSKSMLDDFQIMMFPGGFSYGDDTGSGKALANRIKNNLIDEIAAFIKRDTLMLGICNGFQVIVNLGVVPAIEGFTGRSTAALEYNKSFRYQCRWVDLHVDRDSPCVFTTGIEKMHIPVAHGEGNFFAPPELINSITQKKLAVLKYVKPDGQPASGEFPYNPNGSTDDIAAVCSPDGRIMGMMPHPERGMFFTQRDDWTLLREEYGRQGRPIPEFSDGIEIFRNAVKYFN